MFHLNCCATYKQYIYISSIYQDSEVEFLSTEKENEEGTKTVESSQNIAGTEKQWSL